jgi:hypothetical protein
MATITSANATLTLSQPTLFPAPVKMQQFAVDDVFDTENIRAVETLMGVDGVLSFGFVFVAVVQNIALQANSPSNSFFDVIYTQQQAALDVYPLNGTIILPAISTKFTLSNGALTGYKPTPDGKRTLTPRRFQITWNKIAPAPA